MPTFQSERRSVVGELRICIGRVNRIRAYMPVTFTPGESNSMQVECKKHVQNNIGKIEGIRSRMSSIEGPMDMIK